MLVKEIREERASILNELECNSEGAGHIENILDSAEFKKRLNRPKVSVALDWENIYLSHIQSCGSQFGWEEICELDRYIHEHFDVLNKKAYVDSSTLNGSKKMLESFGYTIVNVPSKTEGVKKSQKMHIRNAVDVEMALDIYDEVLENRKLSTVLLLSGDGDFLPIVKRVKRRGVNVYIFGFEGYVSKILAKFANQVLYLDNLIHIIPGGEISC
jgi:uncharacterized LabA/DUF88 family protein